MVKRQFSLTFDAPVAPFALLLRLIMGWIFLWAGFDKVTGDFTAEGFLLHATSGPLESWFKDLGGDATALSVIDPLVTYSQILMGFAIFFGAFTRLALFFAGGMMFMFYMAQFPPEHDLFADYYIVYIITYSMLGALGAGRVLGTRPFHRKAVPRSQISTAEAASGVRGARISGRSDRITRIHGSRTQFVSEG